MNALRQAARERAAYTLGEPQVAGPLAVFPVFGPHPRLRYRAFVQAAELGAFVKEVESGAVVSRLSVENPTDLPLLVYEGEEVLGAQQNRVFDVSALVPAGERVLVPVSCVEQGRWDHTRHGEALRPSPQAADPSLRRTKRATANAAGRVDQNEVWAEVSGRLAAHGVQSHSAAMSDLYDSRRAALDPLGRAIRHVDGQIGALACVSRRPVALDLVSRADVFAALLPPLAQGYALDALGAAEQGPDAEWVDEFLRSALEPPRRARRTAGLGRAVVLGTRSPIGAGLEHEGELIQLAAFPADGAAAGRPPDRPSVAAARLTPKTDESRLDFRRNALPCIDMTVTETLLQNNEAYAAGFDKGDLPLPPGRKVAVLACMDARLDPARVLGLEEGDAHVIRNAGGVASDDALRSLAISQHLLGTEEIVLIHHTDCGMLTFTDEDFAEKMESETGSRPEWRTHAFSDLEQDVRDALERIRQSPYVPRTDNVRGFVYEVESGRLREVS